jgi:hypothetical protein
MTLKETVLNKVKENDAEWFYCIYNKEFYGYFPANDDAEFDDDDLRDEHFQKIYKDCFEKIKSVYCENNGDGHRMYNCYEITVENDEKLIVQIEGDYSSWGNSEWDKVYLATPYEFRETRYKRAE